VINGIFLINKRKYETSSKTLSTFKKNTKIKKAGIFGILDPLATGTLPIITGEATKYITYIRRTKKMYMVQCKLGVFSDCGDYESQPISFKNEVNIINNLTSSIIKKTFNKFLGTYMQLPPMFSASKYKGKPLYSYARNNIKVKREYKERNIYKLDFISLKNDILSFNVTCSSGTYIRALVQDISREWGLHSCLYNLDRTAVEPFENFSSVDVNDISLDNIEKKVIKLTNMLTDIPEIICNNTEIDKLYCGLSIYKSNKADYSLCKIICENNIFHGVGFFKESVLYPKRLMKR